MNIYQFMSDSPFLAFLLAVIVGEVVVRRTGEFAEPHPAALEY